MRLFDINPDNIMQLTDANKMMLVSFKNIVFDIRLVMINLNYGAYF